MKNKETERFFEQIMNNPLSLESSLSTNIKVIDQAIQYFKNETNHILDINPSFDGQLLRLLRLDQAKTIALLNHHQIEQLLSKEEVHAYVMMDKIKNIQFDGIIALNLNKDKAVSELKHIMQQQTSCIILMSVIDSIIFEHDYEIIIKDSYTYKAIHYQLQIIKK
ncbi:hypothetical protein [Liberiplasma polymorphum]|jgi:hypothetical protein|uniref:hypothetical protein n=1 Tax=Liberiplasma polymorphum TaxID=3374570 RepID=UPI00377193A2